MAMMAKRTGCMICDDASAMRAIDEELAKGVTGSATARLMTLRGFKVSANSVNSHNNHRIPTPPAAAGLRKGDLAAIVRDKVAERVADDEFDIMERQYQPAITSGLKAQAILDKREQKKPVVSFWVQLYTGQQGEVPQLPDGMVIDGESIPLD